MMSKLSEKIQRRLDLTRIKSLEERLTKSKSLEDRIDDFILRKAEESKHLAERVKFLEEQLKGKDLLIADLNEQLEAYSDSAEKLRSHLAGTLQQLRIRSGRNPGPR